MHDTQQHPPIKYGESVTTSKNGRRRCRRSSSTSPPHQPKSPPVSPTCRDPKSSLRKSSCDSFSDSQGQGSTLENRRGLKIPVISSGYFVSICSYHRVKFINRLPRV